jgi:hypothetical protein
MLAADAFIDTRDFEVLILESVKEAENTTDITAVR